MVAGLRTGIVVRGLVVPVLALWGCGSTLPSPPNQDALGTPADGDTDGPVAPDGAVDMLAADHAVEVSQTRGTDVPSAPDSPADIVADGGSQDIPAVCAIPLGFYSNSQPPTMCHGVVLKTYAIPFSPDDPRWSTLYQDCLANYVSSGYPDTCRKLCTALTIANPPPIFLQGIDWCTLDCSQPGAPVLSVRYSDTICEPIPPRDAGSGSDTRPDAGLDGRLDGSIDGSIDAGPTAVDGGRPTRITLRNVTAYGNCMPSIAADPIIVLWTVDITDGIGASAQLAKATITVSKGTSIVQDFTVENPTVALVSGAGSADQRKPLGSVSPNQACSSMCSGATYQLDLVFDNNGRSISASASGAFSCAY